MTSKGSKKAKRPRAIPISRGPAIEAPVSVPSRIFGYARVSREDQNPEMQITALNNAGCDRIFIDKLSGRTDQRPEFRLVLKHLRPGDTLKVYAFSRLFRNSQQLIELFDRFNRQNIKLVSLTEHIDIRTSHGRMSAKILAAVDEAEVERLAERTRDGMAEKKRQGVRFGAPAKVSPEDAKIMKRMRFKEKIKVPLIASRFHVSAAAVYQHTKPRGAAVRAL